MDNYTLENSTVPQYRICVSGAAETTYCGEGAKEKALALGRAIIKYEGILIDGATTGFPLWAAEGAKKAGGIVIGFSPAVSEKEHTKLYRLPTVYHDIIVHTGFGYSGRNLILTRSSDAVIIGCGRIGTINEFTIAFEDKKIIGVLEGDWEVDEIIKDMITRSHRGKGHIVYSQDPDELVKKVIELIDESRKDSKHESEKDIVEELQDTTDQ